MQIKFTVSQRTVHHPMEEGGRGEQSSLSFKGTYTITAFCEQSCFFCYQQFFFFFFSHTTQHNIQNTTKQNNRHILNISRSNQKGGGEGRTTRTQKLLLYIITYIQQKTLPSINGRRPGPTNSRRCTFT